MILVLLSALSLAAALSAPRWLTGAGWAAWTVRAEAFLRRRGALAAALVSIGVVWFTWDQVVPIPKVHDENSYLLQADIFASGRWTAPSPPIAEFFEQPHVQVTPRVASKYPPGHALLLAVGAMVGFHALVPLLLTGITAALIFALALRLTTPWTALATWLVWLSAPLVLRFQPSYFSELTTAPLVLTSWWLLLDWRESRRRSTFLWMALAIGWGAITRPLTMLAFAIPIGVVVLRDCWRLRSWRDLSLGVAVGTAVLMILPLWSWRTTGDWRTSPIEQYRKDYLPFDKLGFTPDTSPPLRPVSPVLRSTYDYFLMARKQQTLAAAPRTAWERVLEVTIAVFQEARLPLLALAAWGLFTAAGAAGTALRFGVGSAAVLLAAHLPYAHWAPWTVYYLETVPVLAALVAVGIADVARRASREGERIGVALACAAILAFAVPNVLKWKRDHRTRSNFDRRFAEQLKTIPTQHAVVFVRYSPRVAQHIAVVFNYADLSKAPIWVVHDMGPRNADLRKLAPDRASFDFDEDQLVAGLRRP